MPYLTSTGRGCVLAPRQKNTGDALEKTGALDSRGLTEYRWISPMDNTETDLPSEPAGKTRGAAAAHPSMRHTALSLLCLLIVGGWTYSNSLDGPFLFDDIPAIVENGDIRSLLPLWRTDGGERTSINSRPVVRLSLAFNYWLGGLEVRGYHVVNLGLHLACALMLLLLLRRTLRRDMLPEVVRSSPHAIAFGAALLWLVHPLNSQCVNYVTQRSSSIAALMLLLTLYALHRGARDRRWLGFSVLACVVGMAAKELMVAAPLLALLYDRTFLAGSFREAMRKRGVTHAALAMTWGVLALLLWSRPHGDTIGQDLGVTTFQYLLNQAQSLATYISLLAWPSPLILDYGYAKALTVADVWAEACIILSLLGFTAWALVRRPVVGFAGAWCFLLLAPTSSFVPLVGEVAAERRMYAPSMALLALVAVLSWQMLAHWRRAWLAPALLLPATLALALTTRARNDDFADVERMWRTVVEARPGNVRARTSLGVALAGRGQLDEAVTHYRQAIAARPTYGDAHYNLGNALLHSGQPQEAAGHYRRALEVDPTDAMAHTNLGVALRQLGQPEAAQRHLHEAVRLDPNLAVAHNNLAIVLRSRSRMQEAIEQFRRAIGADPEYAAAHFNLGAALEDNGERREAIERYREALRLRPGMESARARLQRLQSQRAIR